MSLWASCTRNAGGIRITKTAEKKIKHIPEVEPSEDEIKSFAAAELEIQNGDVSDFDNIDWD